MTASSKDQGLSRTVDIIVALGFGVIEGLTIRNGLPCYDNEPRIVQSIKLYGQGDEADHARADHDLPLGKEFAALFSEFERLAYCVVDIEVRHSLPFRLVAERKTAALLRGRQR